ncbi:hypothetical protein A2154_04345 [Candidatus Gottesmanbacteria bacterium RBG_16_43_7]|uniref:EamA domain-containing protein n=1 Tax=Candidatus Gottesmanbacteria bacterium RBG_16_43_7 TaxID=1798373 RepID=A0A1F5ZCM5_9BACT|nr:MAG: hypothetical protein A2154_04345 [Candidatus Gottesmanbacteria bacterium RBG_16_43_7]
MREADSDPVVSSVVFTLLITFLTGGLALINGFNLLPLSLVFPSLISGLLYAWGTWCFFKAIKTIEASLMTILTGFGAIVTIITAFIFIGERLNLNQLAGVVMVLVAIILVNFEKKSVNLKQGVVLSLVGTSLFGLAVTNDANILKSYDAISYAPVIFFFTACILCIINFRKIPLIAIHIRNKLNPNLVIYSFLYSIQAVTYYLALDSGAMASQMNAIFKSEIILTVILASVILGERSKMGLKIIASLMVTAGVLMVK